MPSYLSGLVIGDELRAQTLPTNTQVVLIGSEVLTQRYQQALALRDVATQRIGSQATWAGLWAIVKILLTPG